VEEAVGAEAEVEVVMAIILMVTMGPPLPTLPITVHRRLPTATDAVGYPTITHKDTPRILLGHHSSSTAVGTVREVPGHSRCLPPTAGTLTQIAAGPHRGRFQGIVGVDIILGPQVEAHMVVAAMAVAEGDMAAAAVAVGVMDMDMAEAEAEVASIILHHMRADTVLAAAMMEAIVLGVVDRREAVAAAEVSEALASDLDV
jgi:hypothetical protein